MNPRRQEKTRFTISALIFHSLEFFYNNVSIGQSSVEITILLFVSLHVYIYR